MKRALLDAIGAARREKRAVVVATRIDDGHQELFDPDAEAGDRPLASPLADAAREGLRRDRSQSLEHDGERWFLQVLNPPLRLFVVGAVHIAQPLAEMAARAGFSVQIIDPRSAFASELRFPGIAVDTVWPDRALEDADLDARAAVVTLTHDPKLDDPALAAALRSPVFYIGSLGSRKTHGARLGRLRKAGFDDEALDRIHGPVGLAIGAQSPAEIAVAILAEIVATLRGAQA